MFMAMLFITIACIYNKQLFYTYSHSVWPKAVKKLFIILRARVVYDLIADEARSTRSAIRELKIYDASLATRSLEKMY